MKITGIKIFAVGVTLCVAAGIVAAFFVVGSPSAERARRMDQQRVNNLQQISYALDNHYVLKKDLPQSLEELQGIQDVYIESVVDPKTRELYAYRRIDAANYELCATFELDGGSSPDGRMAVATPYSGPYDKMWQHGEGLQCYGLQVRTLDKPRLP
jgi:hypothetical protein